MSGQCYGCRVQFGIFKKEHGCKNCGFSFCSKCLHEKSIPIPKRNNEKHHVCVKCHKVLSGQESDTRTDQYDLPKAYLKRVTALNEKGSQGTQAKSHPAIQPKISADLQKLDKADRDIAMRLERLKESNKPKEKISDTDLNSRLANLKGEKIMPEQKTVYHAPDRRTQVEQIDDLLDEIAAEVEIDSHAPDPVKDVEARLAQLRYGQGGAGLASEGGSRDTGKSNVSTSSSRGPSVPVSSGAEDGNVVDMEEMQRLMQETAKELEIDAQRALEGMQKDKELMEKLAEIQRQRDAKKADNDLDENGDKKMVAGDLKMDKRDNSDDSEDDENSEDDDASARKIIQQYLEEAKIDEKFADLPSPSESREEGVKKTQKGEEHLGSSKTKTKSGGKTSAGSDYDDSDELPYCSICTEDAIIRCKECGFDLYCKRCFRECHQEMGLTDHQTSPYKAPKGYS